MALSAYVEIAGLVPPAGSGGPGRLSGSWPIEDYTLGVTDTITIGSGSTGAGAGKVVYQPLTVRVADPRLFIPLFQDCAAGKLLTSVVLHLVEPTGTPPSVPAKDLVTWTLTNAAVKEEADSGSSPDVPVDSTIAFEYESLAFAFAPVAGGSGSGGGTGAGGTGTGGIGGGTPPPVVPEAPLAVALPLAAGAVGAGALAWRGLGSRRAASAATAAAGAEEVLRSDGGAAPRDSGAVGKGVGGDAASGEGETAGA